MQQTCLAGAAAAGIAAFLTGFAQGEPALIPYSAAMTATGSSVFDEGRTFVHAIDGSGLAEKDGTWVHTKEATQNMWMSDTAPVDASSPKFYCVDLGETYRLGRIKVWNFNMGSWAVRGFKATEVYVTTDASAARSTPAEIRAWGDPVWTGELSQAPGADGYAGCEPMDFLETVDARQVGFVFTSSYGDPRAGLSEVRFFGEKKVEGEPVLAAVSVAPTADGAGLAASARLEESALAATVTALAFPSPDAEAVRIPLGDGLVEPGETAAGALTGLADNKTYAVCVEGANAAGTLTNGVVKTAYTGVPALARKADGQEKGCVPAEVTVSRAAADPYPLEVRYGLSSGNGAEGADWAASPGVVTIPANETSAVISIVPLVNPDNAEDVRVVVSLAPGLYLTAGAAAATVTIANATVPGDANVWVAGSASDGLASTGLNWSKGVPRADAPESLVILLDGGYSSHDLTWDADGSTPLAATVASWTQTAAYAGTVTVRTTYPAHASPFKTLAVTGAMVVEGGAITHPVSVVWDDLWNKEMTLARLRADYSYRLSLSAGTFTLGANARIDAAGKGHSWLRRTQNVQGVCPSHGGRNEETTIGCYGNPKYPEDVGTASNFGTDSIAKTAVGGGAVKLVVAGACVIDGEVSVDGLQADGKLAAGAAGSVLVEAARVSGSGIVHADGIFSGNDGQPNGAAGRIAVLTKEPADLSSLVLSASGTGAGRGAACGTVFVKDATMANGVLFLRNRLNAANAGATARRGTYVTSEEGVDWTFDRVVLSGNAQLYVPAGATLGLPNGFASVDASANGERRLSGVVCAGGTIAAGPGDQTLSGRWYFAPVADYAFPAGVTLEKGARIGFPEPFEQALKNGAEPSEANVWAIRCTIPGDCTVDAESGFSADQAGPVQQGGAQAAGVTVGYHGGRAKADGLTMGSVFSPALAPVGQSNSYGYMKPGAAMVVTVGGRLTLDGRASANPVDSANGGYEFAAGGSLNFTVGELAGRGAFMAQGFRDGQCGGRIAVRLTKPGATFDAFAGTFSAKTAESAARSTPGSVYLETAAEGGGRGTVRIDNASAKAATAALSVPVCANGYGADAASAFKNAALDVRGGACAQVAVADAAGLFRMRSLALAANGRLDLNGKTLRVSSARLGGKALSPGVYSANSPETQGLLADSSESQTGVLEVAGNGFLLIVR